LFQYLLQCYCIVLVLVWNNNLIDSLIEKKCVRHVLYVYIYG
jgi:hypothetical protein